MATSTRELLKSAYWWVASMRSVSPGLRRPKSDSAGISTALVKNGIELIQSSRAAVAAMAHHLAAGFLQGLQGQRHLCQIPFAIRGQPHRARAADEELDAELRLQS